MLFSAMAGCSKADLGSDTADFSREVKTRVQGDGVYETLGYGYDITGEYLDFYSIKKPVVDVAAFIRDYPSKYHNPFIGNIKTNVYAGENFMSYMREVQTTSGFSASVKPKITGTDSAAFSGSVDNVTKKKRDFTSKYSYARADVIKRQRQHEIDATPANLADYLSADFVDDLNNLTPMQVVEKYGTHVMLNIEVGGIYKANYKTQVIRASSLDSKTKTAKVGVSLNLAVVGINIGGSSSTTTITEKDIQEVGWQFELESHGGNTNGLTLSFSSATPTPSTTINIGTWAASVDDTHSVLVHINWDNAYPIYDFISDPAKQQAIKNAAIEYIANAKVEMLELMPLYQIYRSDVTNTYNVYSERELDSLLNEAPSKKYREFRGVVGYVLKEPVNMYCEPLYSIKRSSNNNRFTVFMDSELYYYLHVRSGYNDRQYLGQTGYAYTIQMPNTLPFYRINSTSNNNTFSVLGDEQLNYWLHVRSGYKDRTLHGQTGYIYPPGFNE